MIHGVPQFLLRNSKKQAGLRLFSKTRRNLLSGFLVSVPIFLTAYIVGTVITWINNTVRSLIPSAYRLDWYFPFPIPGIFTTLILITIALIIIILIGAFTSCILGTLFLRVSEKLLHKTPIIRNIYSIIKQILETLLIKNTGAFREVGLVEYPRVGILSLCFITGTTIEEIKNGIVDEIVNVFIPTTPNPTSGFLLFIPRKEIRILSITVEEGLKLVISAGMVLPKKEVS